MIPKKLHIFINQQCNLKCKYCYWDSHTKMEMSEETIEKICDFVNSNPDKYDYIIFFGGEPMLSHNIMAKFINSIENKEMNYIVMTNGTINPELFLTTVNTEEHNICFTISYDGLYQEDRGTNLNVIIEKNIEYLKSRNDVTYTIACILSPYQYKKIPESMVKILKLSDSAIFFRICNLHDEWNIEDLLDHIKDFKKIVDIGVFNTVCKEKDVLLSNRIDKTIEENADNVLGSKGNYCQKSLVYTDVVGLDGKKYLCEVAFAKGGPNYGYLWEDRDTIAIEYNQTHKDDTFHRCLYYGTESKIYDTAMEKLRIKYHKMKECLLRLKESKRTYLKTISKDDDRLWRLANDKYKR